MKTDFDAIVLGLGGIGSAAAYWLSKRLGGDVLGLEQYDLGHDRGGSQDHSRIIRYSYHAADYVELAKQAYDAWAIVEVESGSQLVIKAGGLDLFPASCANQMVDYSASLAAGDIDFELLDSDEIRRRWPQFRIDDDTRALFQADGGLVRAATANETHRRLAVEHGAMLHAGTPVSSIHPAAGEFEVVTSAATYRCQHLVITAGAWTRSVLHHFDLDLPLTVTREQVVYFQPTGQARSSPARLPIWIWMEEPCFYGFPEIDGRGLKVAQDVGGYETTAESRTFDPDLDNLARLRAFCDRHLPRASGDIETIKTCLYTLPPDRDFIVDRLPESANCLVAVGAGHAFKFASALGRILAEMALDGGTDVDVERFRIDRPILLEHDPPKNFRI